MNFESTWNPHSPVAQQRREAALARLAQWQALQDRAALASAQSKPVFDKRGQLLPRERVALLLDPGAPFLPLCALAGFMQDTPDPTKSVPGGGMIAGIGFISGVRCMVVASDSGIDAGAIQAMGLDKILRVQEIALQNKLPFVHLVESAGANLMKYRVEGFVHGGALFRNLARLSAAGLPVITVQHGSGTAGGAYMPGLSDVVVMVRGRSRAFLAGPPLLKAATGEIATEEELGGAEMHTALSGLGEHLAEDDRHALGIAREVVGRLGTAFCPQRPAQAPNAPPPLYPADDLLALMPETLREPVDESWFSLGRRKGWLSLRGRDSLASPFDQSLVARRLQHFQASAETCLSFQPWNFKQSAGLIAYYDRFHHHYFRVTSAGEGRVKLGVISSQDSKAGYVHAAELPLAAAEKIFLRMDNSFAELRFSWSTDGVGWHCVDHVFESTMLGDWVSPHSNFTGTFWGICCQDLSDRSAWADFDYFNYQPRD